MATFFFPNWRRVNPRRHPDKPLFAEKGGRDTESNCMDNNYNSDHKNNVEPNQDYDKNLTATAKDMSK